MNQAKPSHAGICQARIHSKLTVAPFQDVEHTVLVHRGPTLLHDRGSVWGVVKGLEAPT